MRLTIFIIITSVLLQLGSAGTLAQSKVQPPTQQDVERAEKLLKAGNELMKQDRPAEAFVRYKEALSINSTHPSLLFNAGLAAYLTNDYPSAADLWSRLKSAQPQNWLVRTKLIQVYQAMMKTAERDAERAELFQLRQSGKVEELSQQQYYRRDQFEVKDLKVVVFEHFELKGKMAVRYAFVVFNEQGDGEKFRISLGSYQFTNQFWREAADPKPKRGERLFHLDGYFGASHTTYGMYSPEPTYDEVRRLVIEIMEKQPASRRLPKENQ